ncbi:MAG: polysaccharide deacetylase family protein [Edaphocola sp.]
METLLIFATPLTPRHRYTFDWIFAERLGLPHSITDNKEEWENYGGPKINYSNADLHGQQLKIVAHGLLADTAITEVKPAIHRWKHSTILFYNQPGAPVPFDIFAAVFYLISRYEEYTTAETDEHGRYPHQNSVAARYSFLQEPVVDVWLLHLAMLLQQMFGLQAPLPKFRFVPSYDVDVAWKFKYKTLSNTIGGLAKDMLKMRPGAVANRLLALPGYRQDPWFVFDDMNKLCARHNHSPLYFFLVAKDGSKYDHNADPQLPEMRKLISTLSKGHAWGLHPSYLSYQSLHTLQAEYATLENIVQQKPEWSRQHYLKVHLPLTYQNLVAAGIKEDFSMGYAGVNGFRAGTSHSFPWYDLSKEMATGLRVHPFVYMDATSRFYQKGNTKDAWDELERLLHIVKETNGVFVGIWHNHFLGTDAANKHWRKLHERVLQYAATLC